MATVTFYQPTDMLSSFIWYGDVKSFSSSHITLSDGVHEQTYYGSFTYSADDLSGGVVTGADHWTSGVLDYSVRNALADALTVDYYLDTYQKLVLQEYVLQASDTLYGSGGSDTLFSYSGNDVIYGGAGNDYVQGNQGNDWVYGGTGDDLAAGGKDNDNVYGESGNDVVRGGLGSDTLGGGTGNDFLSAGQDNDVLFGGAGNDFLQGLLGVDTLTGGSEADVFIFNRPGAQNADYVTDFTHDVDLLAIDSSVFSSLAGSAGDYLAPQNFRAAPNVSAQTGDQFVLYDTASGELFYDADGSGPGGATLMATLTNHAVLDAGDISVF